MSRCNIHPDISLCASPSRRSSWQLAQPPTAALPWRGGTRLSQTPPWPPQAPYRTGVVVVGWWFLLPFPFRTVPLPFTVSPPARSRSGTEPALPPSAVGAGAHERFSVPATRVRAVPCKASSEDTKTPARLKGPRDHPQGVRLSEGACPQPRCVCDNVTRCPPQQR